MSSERTQAAARPHGRRFLVCWVVLSLIATPLVWYLVGPELPPGNATVQASGERFDTAIVVAVAIPVLAFVLTFIAYALLAFRVSDTDGGDGLSDRGSRVIQTVWIVVTSLVMCSLAAFGSFELVKDGSGGGQGPSAAFRPGGAAYALNVQVIAQQWQFTYRYPSYGGVETPHLVLPADTLVELHVTSLDVVHSFWAYELGVKADANPGTDNVVYVQLRKPLTFHIRCVEVCGLWHGYMFDTGRVVAPARFRTWIVQQRRIFAPVQRYLPPYATSYVPAPVYRGG